MYTQITSEERYTIACCRAARMSVEEIAAITGRHRSTIYREVARNLGSGGRYRCSKAQEKTNGRRSRSRRNRHFGQEDWAIVERFLREKWSPEQISGRLRKEGVLRISHETIYQHIWRDKKAGGELHKHLRCAPKKCRKRYRSHDSRGRLAGKRDITERPPGVEERSEIGHWETDTVMGSGDRNCIVTMVERKTAVVVIGKLESRTKEEVHKRMVGLIRAQKHPVLTMTADNGTEFHGYKNIEKLTGVEFYFAKPYHSWERGLNENTNGLIRQYLPKGTSMAHLTQWECTRIADKLNNRPRKRLGYRTPRECYDSD
jgi:transposase, IS30 family